MYVSSLAAWLVDMPVTMVRQVHQTGVADVPLPSRQLSLSKRLLKNVDQSLYKRTACETYVGADVAPLNISVRNPPGGISREKRGVTPSNK